MKRIIPLLLFLLLRGVAQGQPASRLDSIHHIHHSVYQVIAEAFNSYDVDRFFSVVAADAMLVLPERSQIADRNGYRNIISGAAEFQKNKGFHRSISFRFNRFALNGHLGYAEGVFRVTLRQSGTGKEQHQYFSFRDIFRFENGRWWLFLDQHAPLNPVLGEREYRHAKELRSLHLI